MKACRPGLPARQRRPDPDRPDPGPREHPLAWGGQACVVPDPLRAASLANAKGLEHHPYGRGISRIDQCMLQSRHFLV